MAEPKDTTSFFRKVVSSSPTRRRNGPISTRRPEDTRESDYRQGRAQGDDRAQAPQRFRPQARVRHAAQGAPRGPLAASSSPRSAARRASTIRCRAVRHAARQDTGVKAKIDEIEQQMVGDNYAATQPHARPSSTTRRRRRRRSTCAPRHAGRGRRRTAAGRRLRGVTPAPAGIAPAHRPPRGRTGAAPPAAARRRSLAPIHLEPAAGRASSASAFGRGAPRSATTPTSTKP